MTSSKFRLVPLERLTARDFVNAPLWAGYYASDELEEIARWTGSVDHARAALEAVDWADDHYFPLPVEAVHTTWTRGKLFSAAALTAGGETLSAYVGEHHDYVVVFSGDERFVLTEYTPDEEGRLATKLGAHSALPLQIANRVTGENWIYPAS